MSCLNMQFMSKIVTKYSQGILTKIAVLVWDLRHQLEIHVKVLLM